MNPSFTIAVRKDAVVILRDGVVCSVLNGQSVDLYAGLIDDCGMESATQSMFIRSESAARDAALGADDAFMPAAPPIRTGLPSASDGEELSEDDLKDAAAVLGCEVACIKAVMEIESSGKGFFASNRPKILFESHIFSRLTNHKYDTTHPGLSSRHWDCRSYEGGEKEYGRLVKAMVLDREAALAAASWGRFQIMGFNYRKAGYTSLDAFIEAMFQSERNQLTAFIVFLQTTGLDVYLREKRWAELARGYNGPGGAKANDHISYARRLAEAYAQATGQAVCIDRLR